jgi:signal transduction histidine kinase
VESSKEEIVRRAHEERQRELATDLATLERQLAALAEVADRVHGLDETRRILDVALEAILRTLDLKAAWVFLGRQSEGRLQLAAHRGIARSYLDEVARDGLGECLCPEVFWTGHRMLAHNTTQCPRMPHIVEGLAGPVVHACIPLQFEGERRGVLNVAARPREQFSERDLRFLETLGHQIATAMERAEHLQAERRRNQEARALAAINKAIGGSLDAEAILRAVGQTAREVIGAERVQIFLGSDPRRLRVAHLSGLPHPELQEGATLDLVAAGARLQVRALERAEACTVDDWQTDPRVSRDLARRWGAAAGIVVPLRAGEAILGLLVLTRTSPYRWREEDVDVAEALAGQASVALENARLYEEARSAYEDLKAAQLRIVQSEKMAVLGTFASGLAHEVRNPLNSIGLQLSILERRMTRADDEVAALLREGIEVIREEIQRLDALVSDFLLFSKTSRVQYRPGSLDGLVDEVIRLLAPEADQGGVSLAHRRHGPPVPELTMDVEKMKQVLINLVRNAIEAMPDGGSVVVETRAADGRAQVVVRDTGPGLPEGVDIFQLFVTTKPKGTGLGLSIAQQIVLEHGGELAAASHAGRGATFTISVPLARPEDAPQEVDTP